jgi:hypothetical protein
MSAWVPISFEKEVGIYSLRACCMTSGLWIWRIFDKSRRDERAIPVGVGDANTSDAAFAKAEACLVKLQKDCPSTLEVQKA